MDRRQLVSFALPLAGLLVTVSELVRLMEAQRNAEAPDPLLFLVAGMFGLVFLARLVFVAIRYWRASRP